LVQDFTNNPQSLTSHPFKMMHTISESEQCKALLLRENAIMAVMEDGNGDAIMVQLCYLQEKQKFASLQMSSISAPLWL
jgi:hypothetical protein